jgi:hypothetical protein
LIDAEGGFLLLPNNYFIVSDLHFTETSEITKFYKRGESVWWEGDDVAP